MKQNPTTMHNTSHRRTIRFIAVSFASLAFVLLSVCLFAYFKAKQVSQEYSGEILRTYKGLGLVNDLFGNKELTQKLLSGHVFAAGASKDSLRQQFRQAHDLNTVVLRQLDTLLQDPAQREILELLIKERKAYYIYADSLLRLSEENSEEAEDFLRTRIGPVYSQHQELLIELSNAVTVSSKAQTHEAIHLFSSIVTEYAILLLVALASVVVAAFLLRNVFKRLHQENNTLNAEIRERRHLQDALLESRQEFRRLFDRNPIPMWVYDQHTLRFLEVNKAAIQEYGYTREEFLGLTLLDIRPLEEREKFVFRVQQLQKSANAASNGYTHQRKDGSTFKVEIRSHAFPETGNAHPRLVVAVNVHEREAAIEQLKKNEKQLREVSSSIPGAVYQFLTDSEGNVRFPFISEGIFKLYGVTAEEAYTDPNKLFSPIHPDDLGTVMQSTEESTRNLAPWMQEFRVWHPSQCKWKWIRGHGLRTQKEDGSVLSNGTLIDITDQKEAQEQLKASEANLRTLLDSSPQSVYLLDPEGNLVAFNKVAEDEVRKHLLKPLTIGQNILSFIDPVHQQQFAGNHRQAMQGKTIHYEEGFGDYWHEVALKPVFDRNNQVIGTTLSIHDRSEQKKAVELIKRNEAQLAKAQQMAKIGSWEYNLGKNTFTMSGTMYAILGLPFSTFAPTFSNMVNRVHPQDRLRVSGVYKQALATCQDFTCEHRVVTDDGAIRFLSHIVEIICGENGVPVKALGTTQDVTDRKLAEQEIMEAKNLLQSTIENIPEVIFSANGQLKVSYISPQCREITGYTEKEFLESARLWLRTVHQEDKESLLQNTMSALQGGKKVNHEVRIATRDGQTKWLLLRLSPMLDGNGQLLRIDGSASDMTQYKEAQQQQQKLTEQLLKQNQSLQQFAYIVSHNLRMPIANLLGLVSIYDRDTPTAPINHQVVDNLVKSAQLLDTTIRDLNELLTIRSQIGAIREQVYFEQVLDDVLVGLQGEIRQSGASIRSDFTGAPCAKTVKSFAYSIVHNLVSNAIKYRQPDRKPEVTLTTFEVNGYICLTIRDNGLGMDLERQGDKVFGLYKRFHPKIEGKGIGLHLVKTQAELLGGKVEVESRPGQGSSFHVYFTTLQYHEHHQESNVG